VDAPNTGLWLGETKSDSVEKISTSFKAEIDQEKCIKCGKCKDVCMFSAIEKNENYHVNPLFCEGCGACQIICPVNAIKLNPVKNGEIRIRNTKYDFPLISAQLYPGESGSGKIVEQLRKKAEEFDHEIMILDAAAGTGCPVIASVRGCDYTVLVTEPTPSGFSDLKRVLEVVNHFKIPYGIAINKWDIYPKLSKKIEKWSKDKFLGKISYDKKVIDCIVNLKPVIFSDSKVVNEIKGIYKKLNI
jgi:MinD superfamily P-loop ATPase